MQINPSHTESFFLCRFSVDLERSFISLCELVKTIMSVKKFVYPSTIDDYQIQSTRSHRSCHWADDLHGNVFLVWIETWQDRERDESKRRNFLFILVLCPTWMKDKLPVLLVDLNESGFNEQFDSNRCEFIRWIDRCGIIALFALSIYRRRYLNKRQ